jgi:hypothetical protein
MAARDPGGAPHTNTIRRNPELQLRMREDLEYWERKDPLHFPLAAILNQMRRQDAG